MSTKCRESGCGGAGTRAGGRCRRHERLARGRQTGRAYSPRGDDREAFLRLRVLRRTAAKLRAAQEEVGWSSRAVVVAILDNWAVGRPWKPRPAAVGAVVFVVACFAGPTSWRCAALEIAPPPAQLPMEFPPVLPDEALVGVKEGPPARPRGIPPRPEPWQKPPPCDLEAGEEAINGACWAKMARKPPCGSKMREHAGACWRAVAKLPVVPVAVQP